MIIRQPVFLVLGQEWNWIAHPRQCRCHERSLLIPVSHQGTFSVFRWHNLTWVLSHPGKVALYKLSNKNELTLASLTVRHYRSARSNFWAWSTEIRPTGVAWLARNIIEGGHSKQLPLQTILNYCFMLEWILATIWTIALLWRPFFLSGSEM